MSRPIHDENIKFVAYHYIIMRRRSGRSLQLTYHRDSASARLTYPLLPSTTLYFHIQPSTTIRSLRLADGETKYTKSLRTTDRYNYILQYRSPYVRLVRVYVRSHADVVMERLRTKSFSLRCVESDVPAGEVAGTSGDRVLTPKSVVYTI